MLKPALKTRALALAALSIIAAAMGVACLSGPADGGFRERSGGLISEANEANPIAPDSQESEAESSLQRSTRLLRWLRLQSDCWADQLLRQRLRDCFHANRVRAV